MNEDTISPEEMVEQTTKLVAAYVSHNPIRTADLTGLIATVHTSLKSIAAYEPELERPDPAVPINKSVTRHHLICLEDGAKLKMLKRYLRSRYDMTPDQYRARWGLPRDYPMVAPEYAERRSKFAKEIGLGKSRRT